MEQKEVPVKPPVVELESFKIIEAFSFRHVGGPITEVSYIDTNGKSLRDFAREQSDRMLTASVQLVKIGEGTGMFNGQEIKVRTKALERLGGRIFLDAQVFTREQVEALPLGDTLTEKQKSNLLWDMNTNKHDKLVRTRMGTWESFDEGDSVMSTKKQESR